MTSKISIGSDAPSNRVSGDFTITKIQTATRWPISSVSMTLNGASGICLRIAGEGPDQGHLWLDLRPRDRFDGIQIYGSIPVNDGQMRGGVGFPPGKGVDLYVDGRRDMDARRVGTAPDGSPRVNDLLIGEGYGLKPEENNCSRAH